MKQRIEGMKDAEGKYINPEFPKLIYVIDENNCLNGGKYDYLTHLALDCANKTQEPSFISAKKCVKTIVAMSFRQWALEVF